MGYVVVDQRIDDNGNVYYVQLSEAWASEQMAREWADMAGLGGEIVRAGHPRIIESVVV